MATRHPNEPGADDVPHAGAAKPREEDRDRKKWRPVIDHANGGRKIWIERFDWNEKIKADHEAIFGATDTHRYEAQNRILRRFERASTASLERFAGVLEAMTDAQIEEMAQFAKALVDNPFGEVD